MKTTKISALVVLCAAVILLSAVGIAAAATDPDVDRLWNLSNAGPAG